MQHSVRLNHVHLQKLGQRDVRQTQEALRRTWRAAVVPHLDTLPRNKMAQESIVLHRELRVAAQDHHHIAAAAKEL